MSETLPSQERIVRYVNGALTGAYDKLIDKGYSEGDAGALLSDVFDVGYDLVAYVQDPSKQFCWDLSIPGNVWGTWILAGGPLVGAKVLDFLQSIDPGSVPLSTQCSVYFAGLDERFDDFAWQLRAVEVPMWVQVFTAAKTEAKTRATPDIAPSVVSTIPWWVWALGAYAVAREARLWVR